MTREELFGTWPQPSEAELRADAAVQAYHRRCDDWDDANLSGRYHGMSVPLTDDERSRMTANVRNVRAAVQADYQLTPEEFFAALRRWSKRQ